MNLLRAAAPDVSFVVIAYNESARAPDCIRSILGQRTAAVFEVIVVDDGSTDGTGDAVISASAGDQRLRVITLPANRGRGGARAAGVEAARGHSIGFVDADITLPPDWLDRCLAELRGNAAVGGIAVPDGDATVLTRITAARPRAVAGSMPITGNNVLFDAAVLAETPFDRRDRLGEDFRLANRLRRKGLRLLRVPDLTVRHEESKTYLAALSWRFQNGLDAATHPRELGRLRFADVVWLGWLLAWVIGIAGAIAWTPLALALGTVASLWVGVIHAVTRFHPRPIGPFLLACLADIPLLNAYMLGRTIGVPQLIRGRR
jgi:glycosyltransferase involved in cell wall biosynthesis